MEPEQPIEKVLRASAKKRREAAGAPFQLHAADRRLLQGEVARTLGSRANERAGYRRPFWAGFGWSFGVLAGVVAAALLMWPKPPGPNMQLAYVKDLSGANRFQNADRKDSGAKTQIAANGAPTASPGTEAAKSLTGDSDFGVGSPASATAASTKNALVAENSESLAVTRSRESDDLKPMANASLDDTAKRPLAQTFNPAGSVDKNYRLKSEGVLVSKNPSEPARIGGQGNSTQTAASLGLDAATNRTYAFADEDRTAFKKDVPVPGLAGGGANASAVGLETYYNEAKFKESEHAIGRQRFVQVKSPTGVDGPASADGNVLTAFEIVQTGGKLQFIDRDGSIYAGGLEPVMTTRSISGVARRASAPAEEKLLAAPKQKSVRSETETQTAPTTYLFKVVGTNRTSQEKVILNGQILAMAPTNFGTTGGSGNKGTNSSGPLIQLENSKVSGDAQLGERSFKFEAVPAH